MTTAFVDVPVQCCVVPEHRFRIRARRGRVVATVASTACRECGRIVKRVDEPCAPASAESGEAGELHAGTVRSA